MKKQIYVIVRTENENGELHVRRVCRGFDPYELLGFLEKTQLDIIEQLKGMIRPEIITRQFIDEKPIEPVSK